MNLSPSVDKSIPMFEIRDLHVVVEGKEVLKGVSLSVYPGEVHALMGRNGSGKTTLSHTLMGNPRYHVTSGRIFLQGEDITDLPPEERARRHLFLAFQYPVAIPGVTVANFLRAALRNVRKDLTSKDYRQTIRQELKILDIPETFMTRSLNEGFSGGEKKRLETLQLRLLKPKMAILDETDSGLDIDALRVVSNNIQSLKNPEMGILLITHYQRMLNYIKPDKVHVLMDGKMVMSGGPELALQLEDQGYDWVERTTHA